MTTIASDVALPSTASTWVDTFAAQTVQYIELQMTGIRSGGFAVLNEIQAFLADSVPAPTSHQGYNIISLGTVTTDEPGSPPNPSRWSPNEAALSRLVDNTPVQSGNWVTGSGNSADAVVVLDLGEMHRITNVTLNFFLGHRFTDGGRIELSLDGDTYYTLIDSNDPLGSGNYSAAPMPDLQQFARYVRITNKNGNFSNNALLEVEIFSQSIPEPATAGAAAMLLTGAMLRRRRR
jgi:uncharacterized protein (TIGR03382 family)